MDYGPIYAEFLQHCQPVQPPRPWRRFADSTDFWSVPQNRPAALDALGKQYNPKDLLGSGLVTSTPAGNLEFNPIFLGTTDAILPLRTSPQINPFDLLTEQGTVSGRLPIPAAICDHLVRQGIKERGLLLISFRISDLMALRAVGMPAALASGLAQYTANSLPEFHDCVGFAGPRLADTMGSAPSSHPAALVVPDETVANGPSQSVDDPCPARKPSPIVTAEPTTLILLAWMPSQLSNHRPHHLDRVIQNIEYAGSCLGTALDDVLIWQPTRAEIRSIAQCLAVGSLMDVERTILHNLDQSAKPLVPSASKRASSRDLLDTATRMKRALLRSVGSPNDRRLRFREYQQAVDDTFVTPLLKCAAAEADLDERSRLAGVAQVNRLLHPSALLFSAQLEKDVSRRGLRGAGRASEARELMRMFDVLFRLTKGK